MKKNETAITLISLIITIIIILILSGISLTLLSGNNGILFQASIAKKVTNQASALELAQTEATGSFDSNGKFDSESFIYNIKKNLNVSEENITKYNNSDKIKFKLNNYNILVNENGKVQIAVQPGEELENTSYNNYIDSNGKTATIPKGFTVDLSENIIDNGLVIQGPDKSEFVWIPTTINELSQCSQADGTCNLELTSNILICTKHNNNNIVGKLYDNISNSYILGYSGNSGRREPAILDRVDTSDAFTIENLKSEYLEMAISIAKYKGFYIGRYETSLSDADNSDNGSEGTLGTVQSKAGYKPLSVGNTVIKNWYGLYKKQNKTYTGKDNSVSSSMVWGSQYDRIYNWVLQGNDGNKINESNNALHNLTSSYITGKATISGKTDKINNIYDLEGNLTEWTLEANTQANNSQVRIIRGGYYNTAYKPFIINNIPPNQSYSTIGSRLALYIK